MITIKIMSKKTTLMTDVRTKPERSIFIHSLNPISWRPGVHCQIQVGPGFMERHQDYSSRLYIALVIPSSIIFNDHIGPKPSYSMEKNLPANMYLFT